MENKISAWKEKLSSRKMWAAVIAGAASIAAAMFGDALTPEVVDALGYVTAAAAAYIFGEGAVDAVRMIADAIREKYSVPSVGEIVAEIKELEEADESEEAPAEN